VADAVNRPSPTTPIDPTLLMAMLDRILTDLFAFSGLAHESMTRTQGWRFLDLGRRVERAWRTARLLRSTLVVPSAQETPLLEWVLQIADSFMTYRNRYLATLQVAPVLDLLLCDESNPRSIAFQLRQIESHVNELPRTESQASLTAEQRQAISLRNAVRLVDVYELARADTAHRRDALDRALQRLIERLPKLSDAVSSRFLIHAGTPRHLSSSSAAKSR
jgi:uncharacterized alpha-E superfamily protein